MFVSFVVTEKQVFAMCSIQVLPVFHCFFDGGSRRMLMVFERNMEVGEKFVEVGIAFHGIDGIDGIWVETRCLASLKRDGLRVEWFWG